MLDIYGTAIYRWQHYMQVIYNKMQSVIKVALKILNNKYYRFFLLKLLRYNVFY